MGKRDAEVVELADIQYEFALLDAQLELIRKKSSLLGSLGKLHHWLKIALYLISVVQNCCSRPQTLF